MNPTEHLVELYYRNCRNSFTYTDFKVQGGNNRQFDLLAFNKVTNTLRHVEISVTHSTGWTSNLESLKNEIRFKFFGIPKTSVLIILKQISIEEKHIEIKLKTPTINLVLIGQI